MSNDFDNRLNEMIQRGRGNEWLRFEKMDVYLRFGKRMIEQKPKLCITIANISTNKQRKGIFTRLVAKLRVWGFPILLENVLDKDWQKALTDRHGWIVLTDRKEFPSDLILADSLQET